VGSATLQPKVCLDNVQNFHDSNMVIVKFWIHIDDSLDVFAEHAIGGMLGLLANGLFSATYIIGLDGVNADASLYPGGWITHNYKQLYKQLSYMLAATGWSFLMSAILAVIINLIPGLGLRASEEAELLGMDDDQLGEFAYDYVEVRRDYLAWTPAAAEPAMEGTVHPQHMYGTPAHSEMVSPGNIAESEGSEIHHQPELIKEKSEAV
jgi:ammonium transporter, Amt family